MTKIFNIKEAKVLRFTGKFFDGHRSICPVCVDEHHVQGETDEVLDCKNVFVDDTGLEVGQCCCYSESHGIRD